jgi:hypothetical protein
MVNMTKSVWQAAGVLIFAVLVIYTYMLGAEDLKRSSRFRESPYSEVKTLEGAVIPEEGVILPARWGDLGRKMVETGVIDEQKFRSLYARRGGLDEEAEKLLMGRDNGNLRVSRQNAGVILNLLWGLGLANKNPILENGPMVSPQYGGDASRFASTGGWTLAKDVDSTTTGASAMPHYSAHNFLSLTPDQQALVEKVSRGVYRPCCNNSTYFPDCNHGMAMLGLLELMASQGANEEEMWRAALAVNSYWFPDTYLTIARYFESRRISWEKVDPRLVLGPEYSSSSGYEEVLAKVEPVQFEAGGSCGV